MKICKIGFARMRTRCSRQIPLTFLQKIYVIRGASLLLIFADLQSLQEARRLTVMRNLLAARPLLL